MPRKAYRKDANHKDIVAQLRGCGVWVFDLASLGASVDLLCGWRGRLCLVELKTPGKVPKSKPRNEWLTDNESRLHDELVRCGLPYVIALDADEVLGAMQVIASN